ncbi:MAG: hypothetical protein FWH12_06830 [Treponema sp.]|nr:hypothetical protein [Treponema sp.]
MKRLVFFILVFAFFLAFIVFNLENKSDVSLGFRTFQDVPVFLSVLFSFALGMLFAIPIFFSLSRRPKRPGRDSQGYMRDATSPQEIKKESSSYGID